VSHPLNHQISKKQETPVRNFQLAILWPKCRQPCSWKCSVRRSN